MIRPLMELLKIFALSFSMFSISYLCGILPLVIDFSKRRLEMLTIFGSGILIGTALGIIIPEGLQMLIPSESSLYSQSLSYVGPSIIGGFLFMLLVDMFITVMQRADSLNKNSFKITTTIGLVIHAAADGLALGAAASTEIVEVEIVVFLAIMVHKGPAAFTLTTFLVQSSLDRLRIRKHLMIFSLAAPLAAILTFLTLVLLKPYPELSSASHQAYLNPNSTANHENPKHSVPRDSNQSWASALAMLFSAGTFLYVAALHVLPEVGFNQHQACENPKGPKSTVQLDSTSNSSAMAKLLEIEPAGPDAAELANGKLLFTSPGTTISYPKHSLSTLNKYGLLGLGLAIPFLMSLSHTSGQHHHVH